MNPRRSLGLFTVPVLAFSASCLLDTTPLANHEPLAAGPEKGDAQTAEMLPAEVTTDSPALDAATAEAATDAGVALVTPPPSTTPAKPMDAGAMPPMASSKPDAGSTSAPAAPQCNAVGSYGLHTTMEMDWASTPWFDVGTGTVEIYGLLQVDAIDPKTHKAAASFRVCGLSLPQLNSRALCSSYQLQVPQSTWDDGKLPKEPLDGSYECNASQCDLKFAPLSYTMGIQLPDPNAAWPELKDTTPAQFSDDDADGFPGVSVDVVSTASFASGQTGCSRGSGNSGPGNSGPGSSGTNTSNQGNGQRGPGNQPSLPTSIGRLPLAMRTQLTAALQLGPNCKLHETTASDPALDLRAGGCFVSAGSDPSDASSQCSEELRSNFDEILPRYKAATGSKKPSLKVVRFAAGTPISCEQVRSSMF